jgi:uncharacterized protein YbaP (TraB family)
MQKTLMGMLCLVLSLSFAYAQTTAKTNENSLLWKIEGKGIKTSYLFGTIHLAPAQDVKLSEAAAKALASCQQLALELNFKDPNLQQEMMQYALMKDGNSLDKLLSAEDYQLLDSVLEKTTGVKLELVKTMQPVLLTSMIMPIFVEQPLGSYEMLLMEKAPKDMEIMGLETVARQMKALGNMDYTLQAKSMVDIVKKPEIAREQFSTMYKLYQKQAIDELYQFMQNHADLLGSIDALINQRNKEWVAPIGKAAKSKSTFFAVGAGHLGGKNGVVQLLRAKGYKVTPILK